MASSKDFNKDIDQAIAELFIDVDSMGPHRDTPQIERGDAGPGLEGPEYDQMVSNLGLRLLGDSGLLTHALNEATQDQDPLSITYEKLRTRGDDPYGTIEQE